MIQVNETLTKIYRLYPTFGAWARSGARSPLWDSPQNAKYALRDYLGPDAQVLFMESQHIPEEDRPFLRSPAAYETMCRLVDVLYTPGPVPVLANGLFVEAKNAVPA